MHVEAGMGAKPVDDHRRLVGGVVVADQVHLQIGRDLLVERDQEFLELGGAVAAVDRSVDLTGGHVEGGEKVVMPWRR